MDKSKLIKISGLKAKLECMSNSEIKTKIWESNNKFSVRYKLAKTIGDATEYIAKLNILSDEQLDIMDDILSTKVGHFRTKQDVAAFLSSKIYPLLDTNKIDDTAISAVNSVCESIKNEHPDYDPNDITTWGGNKEIGNMYNSLYVDIIEKKEMMLTDKQMQLFTIKKKLFENSMSVEEGKKDLYTMLYDVLDESSIMLLNSFIYGKMEMYTDSMRDKIYDYLKNNPNDPANDMVTGEVGGTEMDALTSKFRYYDAQSFLASKSFLALRMDNQDKLCLIKYIGKNKYNVKEIN